MPELSRRGLFAAAVGVVIAAKLPTQVAPLDNLCLEVPAPGAVEGAVWLDTVQGVYAFTGGQWEKLLKFADRCGNNYKTLGELIEAAP